MTQKKRLFCLVMALMLLLGVSVCNPSSSADDESANTKSYTLEEKVYPLRTQIVPQDIKESEMSLYFVNGGDIPYAKLSDFLDLYGTFFEDENTGTSAVTFKYESLTDDIFLVTRNDTGFDMMVNAKEDKTLFSDLNAFTRSPGNTTLLGLVTIREGGTGGSSNLFTDAGFSYDRYGKYLTFDMSEYDIDLITRDGEAYLPLQTMNDIFMNRIYMLGFFNGDEVLYGSYRSELSKNKYGSAAGEMSEEFARFNYNELRFLMDSFYGLREEHNISDMGTFFMQTELIDGLCSTDPREFDTALRRLLLRYFDDSHSGFLSTSVYTGKVDSDDPDQTLGSLEDLGASMNDRSFLGLVYMG